MFARAARNAAATRITSFLRKYPKTTMLGVAGGCVAGVKAQRARTRQTTMREKTSVYIRMDDMHLVEHKHSTALQLDDSAMELKQLIDTLYDISKDDAIKTVYWDMSYGATVESCGLADLEEIHRALRAVSAAGKVVVSLNKDVTGLKSFYLNGAANLSFLHPRGSFAAPGLSTESFFGRRMLDKHGVKVDVFKNGKFKSAPSVFTSTKSSREERDNKKAFLSSVSQTLFRDSLVVKLCSDFSDDSTRLTKIGLELEETLKNLPKVPAAREPIGFTISDVVDLPFEKNEILLSQYLERKAESARRKAVLDLAKGLVHRMTASLSHQSAYQAYGLCDELEFNPSFQWTPNKPKTVIPLVYISDEIDHKSAKRVVNSLRNIRYNVESGHIKIPHVVLRVASPGGEVVASQKIADELDRLPVPYTVSFGNSAASGAYWISARADQIFSNEMSLTGSIGVYMIRFDFSGALKNAGVNVEHISTGPYTGIDNPLHPITPDMNRVLSNETDKIYQEFKERVAAGRKLSLDQTEQLAGGRIFSGSCAIQNGLADQVGGLKEVLDYVKEKHDATNAHVEVFPKPEKIPLTKILTLGLLGGKEWPVAGLSLVQQCSDKVRGVVRCLNGDPVKGKGASIMLVGDELSAIELAWKQLCDDSL